jgi:hypothetical protein
MKNISRILNTEKEDTMKFYKTNTQSPITIIFITVLLGWGVFMPLSGAYQGSNKALAKIYAETINLISIEDDALRVTTRFKLDIIQGSVPDISICIPEGYSILFVKNQKGHEIRDWRIKQDEGKEILIVSFNSQIEGTVQFTVVAEKILKIEDDQIIFDGFRVANALRESGYIGIENKSAFEVDLLETEKIDNIDVHELPIVLINMAAEPPIYGLRYVRHPFTVALGLTKHEQMPVLSAIIDNASVISVFLEDGKIITRVIYTVRNTGKQFLKVKLPDAAHVWYLYVAGKREPLKMNEDGYLMIRLARSPVNQGNVTPFDVEFVYYIRENGFRFLGSERLQFPKVDLVVSKMLWSCYLPVDYQYIHFAGNVEKEKIAQGLRPLLGMDRVFNYDEVAQYNRALDSWEQATPDVTDKEVKKMQEHLKSEFRTGASNEQEAFLSQLRNEITFAEEIERKQMQGGIALFRIELPTSGRLYRFAETFVDGEELYIEFQYVSGWVSTLVKIVIIFGLCLVLYRLRSSLVQGFIKVREWVIAQREFWNWCKTPQGTRVMLGVCAVLLWFVSKVLFAVLVLLFVLTFVKPEWIFRRKKQTVEQQSAQM